MADKAFDRVIISPRERPLSSDVNQGSSDLDRALRDFLMLMGEVRFSSAVPTGIPSNSFVSDSFRTSAPGGMVARVRRGMGFQYLGSDAQTAIDGIQGLNDLSLYKPLQLSADEDINIPAAHPANGRYDIIEVRCDRRRMDNATRDVFNPATEVFDPTVVKKTLSFDLSGRSAVNDATAGINYKQGVEDGTLTVPSTDAGYVKIATIYVPAAAVAISEGSIIDNRRQYTPGGSILAGLTFTCKPDPVNPVAQPGLVSANLPPGWRATVSNYNDGTDNVYRIWILPPGGLSSLQPTVSMRGNNTSQDGTFYASDVWVTSGTLSAPQVTILSNGDAAQPVSNVLAAAANTPYWAIDLYPRRQTGATTTQTGFATATINVGMICGV